MAHFRTAVERALCVAMIPLALLCAACAATSVPTDGTGTLRGQLRLVPREGVPQTRAGGYDDPRYRGVRLMDYSRPGFAVVYVESAAVPTSSQDLHVRSTRFGPRLEPASFAIGAAGVLTLHNDTDVAHVLSSPELGVAQRLGPGDSLKLAVEAPGQLSFVLIDAPEAEAIGFAAPGAFVVPSERGAWELRGVPPGATRVHAWHPRFAPVSRRVTVLPDSALEVELSLGVGLHGEAADAQR